MITVLGSINIDLVAVVERLPIAGETVKSSSYATTPGGKGANQALAAVRAGGKVLMAGSVGGDAHAEVALANLIEAGVDTSAVLRENAPTGAAMIFVGPGGENFIGVVGGANSYVSKDHVKSLPLTAGSTLLMQLEVPLPVVGSALVHARMGGARTILNAAPFDPECVDLISDCDMLVANEMEFSSIAASLGRDTNDRLGCMRTVSLDTGATIVVTLGADGVYVADGYDILPFDALQVDAIDTVGAGDTFCGYLAAGLDSDLSIADAVRRAIAAASLSCTRPGAQAAIPVGAEVDAMIDG